MGEKSLLLSYRQSPNYTPNPHPHTLLPLTQSLCQQPFWFFSLSNLESISRRERLELYFFPIFHICRIHCENVR